MVWEKGKGMTQTVQGVCCSISSLSILIMKIHILGGPGSGKTTLSRDIAARWQVPHYDWDLVARNFGSHLTPYIENA